MSDIDKELLTCEGMAAAHDALTKKYQWFLNIKPVRKFEEIKKTGLHPRSQGCQINTLVKLAIKRDVDKMIFFRPLGTFDSTPRRGETMFSLAIERGALPKILTVDWTFGGTWGLASIIKNDAPNVSNDEIFCEVVRRRGSVAIYEAIPPDQLRVWTKGLPQNDPTSWPSLIVTELSQVEQFS